MYDAVHVFAIGLQTLDQSHSIELSKVTCYDENPWNGGLSLINYINAVSQEISIWGIQIGRVAIRYICCN